MISVYLCSWAMLLSACCPQCQDHHGKSIPAGNTADQDLICESSFHYSISSGQTGPSELKPLLFFPGSLQVRFCLEPFLHQNQRVHLGLLKAIGSLRMGNRQVCVELLFLHFLVLLI